jgi:retron-type reverse transcriptase
VLHPVTGIPRGGIVSPVLANAYLHYILDLWLEIVVKKERKGAAYLCRYSGDKAELQQQALLGDDGSPLD